MMQIVNQEELDLARRIFAMKSGKAKWSDVEQQCGLSKRDAVILLRKFKFRTVFYGNGSKGREEERNKLILDFVNSRGGQSKTQQEVAEYFASIGRPDINRGVVNGVVARARYSGLIESRKECEVGRNGSSRIPTRLYPPGSFVKPSSLPPRTPELLARGKVLWVDLEPRGCRYTPTEEPPYLYCGATQEYDEKRRQFRSWCKDCYEKIIKRPEDEFLCEADEEAPTQRRHKVV